MINPYTISNFNYPQAELEEFFIFTIMVAGKTARVMAPICHRFCWETEYTQPTPIETVHSMRNAGALREQLERCRVGQYSKMERALCHYLDHPFDLRTASVERIEEIPGVGPKTSRFFVVHTRPDVEHAVIDVHIGRWLRELGYTPPKGVSEYAYLEQCFLQEAKKRGKTIADLDLEIWRSRAR
jgi:hypothetical protein